MEFKEKCKLCTREFTNQNEFIKHLELHPFEKECVKCSGVMKVAKHHAYLGHRYICSNCGFMELYAVWD